MIEYIKVLIYYPFLNLLTFLIWAVPGHYAILGIVILTLFVRFLLLIPSRRAAESQRRMAELQPLLEELKQEYGEDRQGLAQAQMELYRTNNISPFSSCLPILIQLPILIILYRAILNGLGTHNPHIYTWVPQPSFVNTNFLGISLTQADHTYILPIIAAILQFVLMRMSMPKSTASSSSDPTVAMQRNFMYLIPLTTLYIAARYPAGIAVYWIVTTLFSVVQQHYVNQKKLQLTGISKAVATVEKKHPEHKKEAEATEKEFAQLEQSTKKGVSVTVRRRKK